MVLTCRFCIQSVTSQEAEGETDTRGEHLNVLVLEPKLIHISNLHKVLYLLSPDQSSKADQLGIVNPIHYTFQVLTTRFYRLNKDVQSGSILGQVVMAGVTENRKMTNNKTAVLLVQKKMETWKFFGAVKAQYEDYLDLKRVTFNQKQVVSKSFSKKLP